MVRQQFGRCHTVGRQQADGYQLGNSLRWQIGQKSRQRWVHLAAGRLVVCNQLFQATAKLAACGLALKRRQAPNVTGMVHEFDVPLGTFLGASSTVAVSSSED